jgi:hypothetical protein
MVEAAPLGDMTYSKQLDEWIWTEIASVIPPSTRHGEHSRPPRSAKAAEKPQAVSQSSTKAEKLEEDRAGGKKFGKRRTRSGAEPNAVSESAGSESTLAHPERTNSPQSETGTETEASSQPSAPPIRLEAGFGDGAHTLCSTELAGKGFTFSRTTEEPLPSSTPKRVTPAQVKAADAEQKMVLNEPEEVRRVHQFAKAIKRAAGAKVKDDPKLLMRTLKRQHKERAKRAKKWEARLQVQEAANDARQSERAALLKARQAAKKERRMMSRVKKLARS